MLLYFDLTESGWSTPHSLQPARTSRKADHGTSMDVPIRTLDGRCDRRHLRVGQGQQRSVKVREGEEDGARSARRDAGAAHPE